MKYTPPTNAQTDTEQYVDATPNTKGSNPPAAVFNEVQAEIINAIIAAGLIPNHDVLDQLAQALAQKANRNGDFTSPLSDVIRGLTSVDKTELLSKIATAATSSHIIGSYWFGKTKTDTVVPAPTLPDHNMYDFTCNKAWKSQAIVNDAGQTTGYQWVAAPEVVPPVDVDVQILITSKFLDIPEQKNQYGGTAYWSYSTKKWTPYPKIIEHLPGWQRVRDIGTIGNGTTITFQRDDNVLTGTIDSAATNTTTLTVGLNFLATTSQDAYTYEVHMQCGASVPILAWPSSVQWIDENQLIDPNKVTIFTFRKQNNVIIGNVGGCY